MRLAKLIYNPVAGDGTFKTKLDFVCAQMQKYGWQVVPYRTGSSHELAASLQDLADLEYEAVFVAGGDGTVHQVINGLLARPKSKAAPALAVFPAGTANDLAVHLGLPGEIGAWCQMVGRGKTRVIDLGKANDRFFHNVASAGLLTDVSHHVNYQIKNVLGRVAYYLKGIEKIPKFRPVTIDLEVAGRTRREEVILFLVLNGKSAGGFTKVAPKADMQDGRLDVLLIKDCSWHKLATLFIRLIRGEHLVCDQVEYFQVPGLVIDCLEPIITDLDGEKGPPFPLQIKCEVQALTVFVP